MKHTKGMVSYQLIDHTADFGIEMKAENANDLFVHMALAMMAQIVETANDRQSMDRVPRTVTIDVEGDDWSDLMVNWLREVLYLWNGQEKVVQTIDPTRLVPFQLSAVVTYRSFNPESDRGISEIKAVTYHQAQVKKMENGQWQARIIFDI